MKLTGGGGEAKRAKKLGETDIPKIWGKPPVPPHIKPKYCLVENEMKKWHDVASSPNSAALGNRVGNSCNRNFP